MDIIMLWMNVFDVVHLIGVMYVMDEREAMDAMGVMDVIYGTVG